MAMSFRTEIAWLQRHKLVGVPSFRVQLLLEHPVFSPRYRVQIHKEGDYFLWLRSPDVINTNFPSF